MVSIFWFVAKKEDLLRDGKSLGVRSAHRVARGLCLGKHFERATYAKRIRAMKELGYHVEIIYLQLASPRLALKRIARRVQQGVHNVQKADVLRRFSRSWHNFQAVYRPLADAWLVYDNSARFSP